VKTKPNRFTTSEEAAEINRRLKRAGFKSTAENCYNYTGVILCEHKGEQIVADIIDDILKSTEGIDADA